MAEAPNKINMIQMPHMGKMGNNSAVAIELRALNIANKARAFAAKCGPDVFSTHDLATFLARPDLDVVCIATPSGAHLEPTLAAARAGKHIVIEKQPGVAWMDIDAAAL
jgi:predicted dehydrogenase